jgi:ABC-type polar amino acid transport system ATPase subunit
MTTTNLEGQEMASKDNGNPPRSVVTVQGATKSFIRGTYALKDVTVDIKAHEVVTLIGPSGSGKSTLLRSIGVLEDLDEGEIRVQGQYVNGGASKAERKKRTLNAGQRSELVGMVFQSFELFPHMTATDNVACGLVRARGHKRAEAKEMAQAQLETVGLGHKSDSYPSQLSGGQQQRVAIARAVAMSPSVMLFDEPTSALDPETVDEVLETLRSLRDSGMTMLIATHEMEFARDVSDRTIFMEAGEIIEISPSKQLFTNPSTERCQTFLRKFLSNV